MRNLMKKIVFLLFSEKNQSSSDKVTDVVITKKNQSSSDKVTDVVINHLKEKAGEAMYPTFLLTRSLEKYKKLLDVATKKALVEVFKMETKAKEWEDECELLTSSITIPDEKSPLQKEIYHRKKMAADKAMQPILLKMWAMRNLAERYREGLRMGAFDMEMEIINNVQHIMKREKLLSPQEWAEKKIRQSEAEIILIKGEEVVSTKIEPQKVSSSSSLLEETIEPPENLNRITRKIILFENRIFLVILKEKANLLKLSSEWRETCMCSGEGPGAIYVAKYKHLGTYSKSVAFVATDNFSEMTDEELSAISEIITT